MSLVRINNGSLAYGYIPLLQNIELVIEPKERLCIVGRNGAGKSSLLKVLAKEVLLDDGVINFNSEIKVSRLQQDPPKTEATSVYAYISKSLAELGQVLDEYHELSHKITADDLSGLSKLAELQSIIEAKDGWQLDNKIIQICQKVGLDPDANILDLSGGWQRKVALAAALVNDPDLLLLDEPTNHLDIDTIEWLEQLLLNYPTTIVFISHDRDFIQKIATRIIDLDRGVLTSWPGNYSSYLSGKAEWLRVELEKNKLFDKRLAEEEVWIRQGVKARKTRNEGRVRALKKLREERQSRINSQGQVNININSAETSGKLVFEVKDLSFKYDDKYLIKDFNLRVLKGDKIAIIGPNGCGKSTLVKLLIDALQPESGEVKIGTKLDIAYFDQYREQLDLEKTIEENVGDGKQTVTVNGVDRHILGYLQDFLFSPQRARTPVKALSGGEKNRLLLAKLLLKPANLIILDEPTNDLDVETLELLEALLTDFNGTLIIISHDRAFIDNTATSSIWYQGDGHWQEFLGGYQDAVAQGAVFYNKDVNITRPVVVKEVIKEKVKAKAKLSYKEAQELQALPVKIENIEAKIADQQLTIAKPGFYNQDPKTIDSELNKLAKLEQEFEDIFKRWEELEAK